jgi:hypothetical protein
LAASVVADPPDESVPVVGGPVTPSFTAKLDAAKSPLASVDFKAAVGAVQDTGMAFPMKLTVGCAGSLLHSVIPPGADGVKPEPETVTLCPLVRFVDGVTLRVAAALATAANESAPAPERISAAEKPSAALRCLRVFLLM